MPAPKQKIIIWGGFWRDSNERLRLEELNSHASVTCYFLTEALSQHFEVVQISSFKGISTAVEHGDAIAILSTFQTGFTQLKNKEPDRLKVVKQGFKGRLCSVVDFASFMSYEEDILFTVLPPGHGFKDFLKRLRGGVSVYYMGWCASPEHCRPRRREIFTIFLDHGHYAGDDYTRVVLDAVNRIRDEASLPQVAVLHQGNDGIKPCPSGYVWQDEDYVRTNKVSWSKIQEYYSGVDLFCVTHRESAGLGVIEAAMSGAHILVPCIDTPFISLELLNTGVPHTLVDCTADVLAEAMSKIIEHGVARAAHHAQLARTHGWDGAAQKIAQVLTG